MADSARIVMHLDMDAFYAAVEMRDDLRLREVPVVVGADPRGGRGRGVVCTANYAARKYGIRSAMPINEAYRRCPHAAYIRPDFPRYHEASERVMETLAGYADVLEQVGLDEAYLDVTERCTDEAGQADWAAATDLARSLQAAVKRATGLSCSIGVAPGKTFAKVASDYRKPHGITVVRPENLRAFLDPLPVRKLHGCGPKSAQRLNEAGYLSVADLGAAPRAELERLFGSHGGWLWHIAQGDDPRRVESERGDRKSRGNESTFFEDQADPDKVLASAKELLEEVASHHARRDARPFGTVTVKVRYTGFTTVTRAQTAPAPFDVRESDTFGRLWAWAERLLRPLLDGRGVRLVGVRLSGFEAPTGQRSLGGWGLLGAGLVQPALHGLPSARPMGAFDPGGLRWGSLAPALPS